MRRFFGPMTPKAVLALTLLGVGLGAFPFALGMLLGIGAFVVTPLLAPVVAIGAGVLLARIARSSPWIGIAWTSATTAAVYASPFIAVAFVNHSFQLGTALIGTLYACAVVLIAGALLSLGAWIGGAWRRRSADVGG